VSATTMSATTLPASPRPLGFDPRLPICPPRLGTTILPPSDTQRPPSPPPPLHIMAGYVLSGTTAAKLELTLKGRPVNDLPVLPPGKHWLPDADDIEDAITAHIAKFPGCEGKVAAELTGTFDYLEVIIVTQDWLLPESQGPNGPLPTAAEGEREECVRLWLESNGNWPSYYCSHLRSVLIVSAGVSRDEYQWDIREDKDLES
jgi:hypothetical protein